MQLFRLASKDWAALAPHHRLFQSLVEIRANALLGIEISQPWGIAEDAGGVWVNHRQLRIGAALVEDVDRPGDPTPSAEELAAAAVIMDIAEHFRAEGPAIFEGLNTPWSGPLVKLFRPQIPSWD